GSRMRNEIVAECTTRAAAIVNDHIGTKFRSELISEDPGELVDGPTCREGNHDLDGARARMTHRRHEHECEAQKRSPGRLGLLPCAPRKQETPAAQVQEVVPLEMC